MVLKTETRAVDSPLPAQQIFSSTSAFSRYQVLFEWRPLFPSAPRTSARQRLLTDGLLLFSGLQPLTNLQRGNVVQEKSGVTLTRTQFELAAQGEIFEGTPIAVTERDQQGLTLLHVAAMHGQMPSVRCLLSRGADISARDKQGHTALHYAAFHGHQHVVRELLQFDGKILDDVDDEGNTAVIFACYQNRALVVQELLKFGADLSLQNRLHESCFSIAQAVEACEVQSLLEKCVLRLLESSSRE